MQWAKALSDDVCPAEKGRGSPVNYVLVRILEDISPFAGPDWNYELSKEDVVMLPESIAKYLIAKKKAAEFMKGWHGEVARLLMYILPYTGLRSSELRRAQIQDIDTKRWRIFVRHPKGEQRYARKRWAPILPPVRGAVIRFLEARDKRLNEFGTGECEALIPARHKGGFGYYSSNSFRKIKAEVSERCGIDFQIKTFRDTYCQQSIDLNPSLTPAVSRTMGHASTRTTEMSYGRIKMDRAVDDIQKLWENEGVSHGENRNSPRINTRYDNTGYA
jgi:integrase